MGILLIVSAMVGLIKLIIFGYIWNEYDHKSVKYRLMKAVSCTAIWAAVLGILYGIIAVVSLMISYDSYLDSRAYYDNLISQYRGAIILYEDKSTSIDMKKAAEYAITDLRFQGYQKKMGDFVLDLRENVTEYNSTIIRKRLMKKNFFYGWYIIPPDKDMQTIDIIDK